MGKRFWLFAMDKKLQMVLAMTVVCFTLSAWDVECIKNNNFTVFYPKKNIREAKEVLGYLEEYKQQLEKLTGNTDSNKLNVVLVDGGLYSNGYASPMTNKIVLYLRPAVKFGDENWLKTVAVHEYIHYLQMSNVSGIPKILKDIIGNSFFTFPNTIEPLWAAEAITVYGESAEISEHNGRLNQGPFNGYVTAAAYEDKLGSISDVTYWDYRKFPNGRVPYIYGGKFFKYLAEKYGKDKFASLYKKYGSGSPQLSVIMPAISMDTVVKEVYGKSYPELWDDWRKSEKENAKKFNVADTKIYSDVNNGISNLIYNDGSLYYILCKEYKYKIIKKNIKDKTEKVLLEDNNIESMKIKGNKLYYLTGEIKSGYSNNIDDGYGVFTIIKELNLDNNMSKEIVRGDIRVFNLIDNGIIYSNELTDNYGTEIIAKMNDGTEKIYGKYNVIISDIEKSGERIFVCGKESNGLENIYELNTTENKLSAIIKTPKAEKEMSVIKNKIYYSAAYNNYDDIYSYNIDNGEIMKETETWGASYPAFDNAENKLYYVGIEARGNNIFEKNSSPVKYSIVEYSQVKKTETKNEIKFEKGSYWDNLASLFPYSRGFKITNEEFQFDIMGEDALGEIKYNLTYKKEYDKDKNGIRLYTIYRDFYMNYGNISLSDIKISKDADLTIGKISKIYSSNQSFVNRIIMDNNIRTWGNDFKEKEYSASVSLTNSGSVSSFVVQVPFESKQLGSTRNRVGVYGDLYLGGGLLWGSYVSDNQSTEEYNAKGSRLYPLVRGYKDAVNTKEWAKLISTIPIFYGDVKASSWNPNVAIEGFQVALFADVMSKNGVSLKNENIMASCGTEIKTNIKGLFGLGFFDLKPGVRLSVNKENEKRADFIIAGGW